MTQHDTLLPWRTVEANVRLPLDIQAQRLDRLIGRGRDPEARDRVAWAINLVGLSGFERHLPGELSGGMRKRAALAQTLAYARETVLMDEPFGALDFQMRLQLQAELLHIWSAERRTIVFVTHDIEEAIALSDEIIILSRRPGRILDTVRVDLPRSSGPGDGSVRPPVSGPVQARVEPRRAPRGRSIPRSRRSEKRGARSVSQVVPGFESAKGVVFGVQDPAVRRRRRTQWLVYAGRIVLLFVVLSAWQYFGPRVGEIAASSPLHVYDSLRRLAASGILWRDPEAEAFQHELEGQPTELATGRDGLRAVQVVAAAVRRLETGCAASP